MTTQGLEDHSSSRKRGDSLGSFQASQQYCWDLKPLDATHQNGGAEMDQNVATAPEGA